MIKGVSRRVVVVKSPDARLFEQAIFILKGDAAQALGAGPEEIMREACRVADQYVRRSRRRRKPKWLDALLFSTCGALMTAAVWLLFRLGLF